MWQTNTLKFFSPFGSDIHVADNILQMSLSANKVGTGHASDLCTCGRHAHHLNIWCYSCQLIMKQIMYKHITQYYIDIKL